MITLTDVAATVTPPAEAVAGAVVPVPWEGLDDKNDFIAVGKPGEKYTSYEYTRNGTPAQLRMPSLPGTYELRYVLNQGRRVIATVPVTVADISVSLNAPSSGQVGTTVAIPFNVPGYARDYIGIGAPGSDDHVAYAYAKKGEVAQLKLPDAPGTYQLFYVMDADRRMMARKPFTVTP